MSASKNCATCAHLVAELRRLLGAKAIALGASELDVEALVRRDVAFIATRAGKSVGGAASVDKSVHFVVEGFVKLVCVVPGRRRPVVLGFFGPGEFVCLPASTPDDRLPSLRVVGHTAATLASFPIGNVRSAFRTDHELTRRSWEFGVRLALDKTMLLGLPLAPRVIHALRGLVPAFGRRQADAWLLDLPLIHIDIADLVAATRSAVTRCLVPLMRAGALARVHRRFLLRDRFMALDLGSYTDEVLKRPRAGDHRPPPPTNHDVSA